jgi:hypothetical protein
MPLPMLETTPPVTKTNFAGWLRLGAVMGDDGQSLIYRP